MLRALSIFISLVLAAVAPAAALEEANALYAAGDFPKAAAAYEALIQSDGTTAARLSNLGNARFRLQQYGQAILAWERAALLAPRDPDIRRNLKLARDAAKSQEPAPARRWWEEPLHWCSLREWSWLAAAGAVLAGAAALAWGIFGMRGAGLKQTLIAALAAGLLLGPLGGMAVWHRRGETALGIIIADQPALRLSPFVAADSAGPVFPGRTVELGRRVPGWVHVTVRGSTQSGWLAENEVAALLPGA